MPTKTRNFTRTYEYETRSFTPCNPPFISYSRVLVTMSETRTGVSNPKWKDQVRAGANAATGMTASIFFVARYESGSASVNFRNSSQPIMPCGTNIGEVSMRGDRYPAFTHIAYGATESEAEFKARTQLLQAIAKTYRHWQGSVFIGELLETARLLIRPAKALRNHLYQYLLSLTNKKRKVTAKQWGRVVADEWLEFNFGVRPLYNDIRECAEAIARFDDPDELRHDYVRGHGVHERLVSCTTDTSVENNFIYVVNTTRDIGRHRVIYRAHMRQNLSGPFYAADRLAKLTGLTPDNWVPALWEIVPFSFVVDYFTNIGDILQNSWTDTSQVDWINKTVIVEGIRDFTSVVDHDKIRSTVQASYGPNGYVGSTGASLGSFKSIARSVSRVPNVQLNNSIFDLSFTVPGLDSMKWLNLAALSAQLNDLNRTSFYRR